jgi:hypothetical protein
MLTDLLLDVFIEIISVVVATIGIHRACRLRLVCRQSMAPSS